jgi:hypothetical protein
MTHEFAKMLVKHTRFVEVQCKCYKILANLWIAIIKGRKRNIDASISGLALVASQPQNRMLFGFFERQMSYASANQSKFANLATATDKTNLGDYYYFTDGHLHATIGFHHTSQ